jgi:hypothetical protein
MCTSAADIEEVLYGIYALIIELLSHGFTLAGVTISALPSALTAVTLFEAV